MKSKRLIKGGLLLVLGLVVAYLLKLGGLAIDIFFPIEITVLLAGFLLGPSYGGFLGVLAPLVSLLIFKDLTVPLLLLLICKLGVYGLLSGMIYREFNLLISLISAITGGRIVFLSGLWIATNLFKIEALMSLISKKNLLTGFYSTLVQMILIPVIVGAINKKSSPKVDYKLRV
jgi:niacin transporter